MGSIKIAPSILSADMANLKGDLDKIAGADFVHFDVMDGPLYRQPHLWR